MTYFTVFCSFIVAVAFTQALSPHPVVVVLSFDGYRREFVTWPEAKYVKQLINDYAAPTCLIPAFPTKTHVNHFTLATGQHPEDHGLINDCVFDRDGQFSEYTYEQYHHNDKDQVVPLWFSTKTHVNHFTLATGLHPEDHGVINDCVFDHRDCAFSEYTYAQYHQDKDGTLQVVPIWIENENQGCGRRSGIMMWPGAEFEFQGKKATYNVDYSELYPRIRNERFTDYRERMKKIFEWIEDEKEPANLVMAYFGELDKSLHFNGPQSESTQEKLQEIDSIISDFIEQLDIKRLRDKINLIIIGGHGRAQVNYDGIIKLSDYLNDEYHNYMTMGANALVYPNPDDLNDVYDKLKEHGNESKSFNVYKQDEIPVDWHLGKSPLLKDKIFLIARPEHCFWGNHELTVFKDKGEDDFQVGADGYDNNDYFMKPFFVGIGPRFRIGRTVIPFDMIDIHPLLKHLLDLTEPASDVQPNTQMSPVVEQMLFLQ